MDDIHYRVQKKYGEYFADLNNPNLPKFADKQFALSKMNLTSMEVSMFNSLFFKLFWLNNKADWIQLLLLTFVSSEELWRSQRVLSAKAVTPPSISIILQMILSLFQLLLIGWTRRWARSWKYPNYFCLTL